RCGAGIMPRIFASMKSRPRASLFSANASGTSRVLSAEYPCIRTDPTRRKSPPKGRKSGVIAEETPRATQFDRVAENGRESSAWKMRWRGANLQVRLPAVSDSVKRAQRTNHVQNCAWIFPLEDKLLKISNLKLVEAAGVEPASEIIVSRENPCSVRFRRVRLM